jgi:catechol 2,3-dioxygenase-like lactoylglutathione lyase family enzyme
MLYSKQEIPPVFRIAKKALDVGVVVVDLERQRRFYGDILGLPYAGFMPVPGGVLHVYLCGDSYLKLYSMDEKPGAQAGAFGSTAGFAYITLTVPDARGAYREAVEKGVTVIAEPGTFDGKATLADPIGRMKARWALLADGDGNMIELIEYCELPDSEG